MRSIYFQIIEKSVKPCFNTNKHVSSKHEYSSNNTTLHELDFY